MVNMSETLEVLPMYDSQKVKKTLSFSYNMHLFLPYLLNDSQTIRSTIHFSKPLLCVTLICGDWSISFQRFKTLQDVFIHLELCYTLHGR